MLVRAEREFDAPNSLDPSEAVARGNRDVLFVIRLIRFGFPLDRLLAINKSYPISNCMQAIIPNAQKVPDRNAYA